MTRDEISKTGPSFIDLRQSAYPRDWVVVVGHDPTFDNEALIPDRLRLGCKIGATGVVLWLAHGGDVAVIMQTDRDGQEVAYGLQEIGPYRRPGIDLDEE